MFFTVIVPVLNSEKFIGRAIESIYAQSCNTIEILVIDGGSTDRTLEVLKKYQDVTVISGADLGPHDAMNRGIEMAHGEVITFLNADDFYVENIFQEVKQEFIKEPRLDIVGGGSVIIRKEGNQEYKLLAERTHESENGLFIEELVLGAPCFNTRFFQKNIFQKIGKFNLSYHYAADRDFLLRAAISEIATKTIDRVTYVFQSHENSRTINNSFINQISISKEHSQIAEDLLTKLTPKHHHGKFLRAWIGFEYLRQLAWNLKSGNWAECYHILVDAFRVDAKWIPFGLNGFLIARRLWKMDQSAKKYGEEILKSFPPI